MRVRIPKRFWRSTDGSASIEFVILFPLYFGILLMALESGMFMARHVFVDQAVDMALRDIRLNPSDPPTFSEFKTSICDNMFEKRNCEDVIQIEMRPVNMTTWQGLDGAPVCRDVTRPLEPFDESAFIAGAANELMMIQVCAIYSPLVPLTPLAMGLISQPGGNYAIIVKSGFVNEPT